jgi:hypothetical protein
LVASLLVYEEKRASAACFHVPLLATMLTKCIQDTLLRNTRKPAPPLVQYSFLTRFVGLASWEGINRVESCVNDNSCISKHQVYSSCAYIPEQESRIST